MGALRTPLIIVSSSAEQLGLSIGFHVLNVRLHFILLNLLILINNIKYLIQLSIYDYIIIGPTFSYFLKAKHRIACGRQPLPALLILFGTPNVTLLFAPYLKLWEGYLLLYIKWENSIELLGICIGHLCFLIGMAKTRSPLSLSS